MRWPVLFLVFSCVLQSCSSGPQSGLPSRLSFDPSAAHPFGRPNPQAPAQLQQFDFLIGHNECSEERLNNATGEWIEGERSWDAHYFLNGFGILDFGTSGGSTNGNVRIFDTATEQWHVSFFSTPVYGSGTWSGGLIEDRIELERPQQAPGTTLDGINRLTFYDISVGGFKWRGEWRSLDGANVFPFWRITCHKVG